MEKMKNKIILICVLFLIPLVVAFQVELIPHYYNDGREVLPTTNTVFSDVAFEIVGNNQDPSFRILNLSIIDSHPVGFKKALPETMVDMLRIKQIKTLFVSQIMDINDLKTGNQTSIDLWVGVQGIHEGGKGVLYSEGHFNFTITELLPIEKENTFFYDLGELIWEGRSKEGLFILIGVVVLVMFLLWRYRPSVWANKWREKQARKQMEKRNASAYY